MNLLKHFGIKMFSDEVMKNKLPHEIYQSLKKSIEFFLPLEPDVAPIVASAMKDWAVQNGATHYTHWFQPMTGITAGKQESFITLDNSTIHLEFSGNELIKGEPDASSFPSGGLRNTFEARGYTTWDCTSPAFIKNKSLYIPTAFCSYNGEALDTKTPLLKSMEVISNEAIKILKAFGDNSTKRVIVNVGIEQEYFLVNRENYEKRLDLKICGRTLFGMKPPKSQEMADHYCGRIRLKVSKFMNELDKTLWAYGICSKTRHNEAAPAQHEMAPMFESCNVAADHNQLIMETLRTVAKKNGLACLLHEKPFQDINGSGKHINWSLSKINGTNLFKCGKTKKEYIQFLIFICALIRGVDLHYDLLRLSAAYAGNDLRLGGNEAPPAIISIFLGEHLLKILQEIANGNFNFEEELNDVLINEVKTLPNLPKDESDRNRTSPFAFTGNKFEFRMLGASASVSFTITIINLIFADSISYFAEILKNEKNLELAAKKIITETMQKHNKIIFNGNSYSEKWEKESANKNLLNFQSTIDVANKFIDKKNVDLFKKFGILSELECKARYKIFLSIYNETVLMEAQTMIEMTNKEILPAILNYINKLSETNLNLINLNIKNATIFNKIKTLSDSLTKIDKNCEKLNNTLQEFKKITDNLNKAIFCKNKILKTMNNLRESVDKIEKYMPKKIWPIPSITDLLFRV